MQLKDDAGAGAEGSRLFCESPCVNVLAPTILAAEEPALWRLHRRAFEKACFQEEGEYCLGRFLNDEVRVARPTSPLSAPTSALEP
jgi:hypothetical protein